jgi:methylthioribose-1-phosphate isomerase
MRTVFWEDDSLKMIDQRCLPASLEVISLHTCLEVIEAIRNMTVRGAPAIGAAAAFGLALAAKGSQAKTTSQLFSDLEYAVAELKASRPTAVNLGWAVDRVMKVIREKGEGRNAWPYSAQR